MTSNKINPYLIPNQLKVSKREAEKNKLNENLKSDFGELLDNQLEKSDTDEIQVSIHAAKRLNERNIQIDGLEYIKIKEAISKLKQKGGQDSLVVTDKAAYIVDVDKNTIVTAMEKGNLEGNVFTQIDSTIIMN